MANQMYDSMRQYNPLMQFQTNFNQQFSAFAENFNKTSSCSPQDQVQQLLNTGRMSQSQFDQYSQIANMMTGRY